MEPPRQRVAAWANQLHLEMHFIWRDTLTWVGCVTLGAEGTGKGVWDGLPGFTHKFQHASVHEPLPL